MISEAHYEGEKPNFSILTYYSILKEGEPNYEKNELQKIATFETGIKDKDAIRCCREAESEMELVPVAERTFDMYYNKVHRKLSKFITKAESTSRSRPS